MSTICLQHICVYDIRFNLRKEMFRVLKNNGYITVQMGFDPKFTSAHNKVSYYMNYYDAPSTNGTFDVAVQSPGQIEDDLLKIGFKNFKYYIRPKHPSEGCHEQWIFLNAQKL